MYWLSGIVSRALNFDLWHCLSASLTVILASHVPVEYSVAVSRNSRKAKEVLYQNYSIDFLAPWLSERGMLVAEIYVQMPDIATVLTSRTLTNGRKFNTLVMVR